MQFKFNLPEPAITQRRTPENWSPFDEWPELAGVVALDTETKDPGLQARRGSSWAIPGEGKVCGFSIAYGGSTPDLPMTSFYAGVDHAGGNCDVDKAWRWLAAQAAKPEVTFCYANAIYDLGWLARYGIEPANLPIDVQGMAALLDEQRQSYSLDALMRDYLGTHKSGDALHKRAWEGFGIPNAIQNMERLPTWVVEQYAVDDAAGTLQLFKRMLPLLQEQDLMRVFELERECLLVGVDLKRRGVRVDPAAVASARKFFEERRTACIATIKDLTGVNVSPDDKKAIAAALQVENPQLTLEKTATGQVSIRAGVIDAMQTPVSKAVREMRQMEKALGTFIAGYLEQYTAVDGRIHADFHPLRRTADDAEGGGNNGTVSGRWSSSSPNLQNIPRRDAVIGPTLRRCFLPEEGELWAKLDYSSQEPRLATHFASMARGWQGKHRWHLPSTQVQGRNGMYRGEAGPLPGAQEMVDLYNANPTLSFHRHVGALMGLPSSGPAYDALKINNLALIYGMSGRTFCVNNGYPTKWVENWKGELVEVAGDEGQALLDAHAAAVPWGRPLAQIAQEAATVRGYTRTILGRRIRYRKHYADGKLMDANKALNHSVQGSAADQMKSAQVLFRRAGIPILVVVHDDGNLSIPRGEAGARRLQDAAEIMESAIRLAVPSVAESKIGETWGDVG